MNADDQKKASSHASALERKSPFGSHPIPIEFRHLGLMSSRWRGRHLAVIKILL